MKSDSMLRAAITISAALHGLLGFWAEAHGFTRARVFPEVADSWTGSGIEIDAVTPATASPDDGKRAEAPPAGNETNEPQGTTATQVARTHRVTQAPREHPAGDDASPEPATHPATAGKAPVQRPSGKTTASTASRTPVATTTAMAGSEGTPSAPSTATNGSEGTPSGPFGAQGLPIGVRHLPKAFTRALSIADRSDPRWLTLPPGAAGEARVEISVDEDGKLGELAYRDEAERARLSPVVRHLLENTRLLLESGRFSLEPSALRAGVQRLRVRVEVVERPASSDADGDPNELKELEYEAPTAARPGRGSFALNSGRRVIGWVYLE